MIEENHLCDIAQNINTFFAQSESNRKFQQDLVQKYPLSKHLGDTYTCPITGHIRLKSQLAEDL